MISNMPHLDSAETVFFTRELANIAKEAYDVKYAQLKGLLYTPVKTDIPPAAESHIYRSYDMRGKAKRMTSPDENLPTVNAFGTESTQRFESYGDAFTYSVDEIRAAAMANRPLDRMRAQAARKVLDQKLDDIIASGDTDAGLTGFLGLSNTTSFNPATGASTSKAWSTKTPTEILADLNGICDAIIVGTKETEKPRRILLPTAQYRLISTTARSSTSDTTILGFFLGNNPGVEVMSWERLATAGAASADRMVAYDPSEMNLHLLLPIAFEQMAPQLAGFSYKINCRMKTGGVISPYPKSVAFGDGI